MGLTAAQQAALALDKNISVKAGAGSGKTRILVERYLKIILQNPKLVRHVVAITFTEKAAGEMQERVAHTVNEKLAANNLSAKDKRALQQVRDQLNSAHISTFHVFCKKILSEFPIEADVPPEFNILDGLQQPLLIHQTVKKVLNQVDKSQSGDPEWIRFFLAIPKYKVEEMLILAVQRAWEMEQILARFTAFSPQEYLQFLEKEWRNWVEMFITNQDLSAAINLIEQITSLDTIADKKPKGETAQKALLSFSQIYKTGADSIAGYEQFIALGQLYTTNDLEAYSNLAQLGGKASWSHETMDLHLQLSTLLSQILLRFNGLFPGAAPGENDVQWLAYFKQFALLFSKVAEQFRQEKRENGLLDFDDLQYEVIALLTKNREIRQQLHERYKYIMVDEFQDTNAIQWEIVRLLIEDAHSISADQTFVVGDPKQSIYGFRNADIRLFKHVVTQFTQRAGLQENSAYEGHVVFKESFRFLPGINAFINHFFKQILQESPQNPYEVGYEDLTAERKVPNSGWVNLALLQSDLEVEQNEATYIATTISAIVGKKNIFEWKDGTEQESPMGYGDIAILLKDRSGLREMERQLRQHNIPYITVAGSGFWESQEIYDFYHLLRFLLNPYDDLALVALLRSYLFLLPDTILYKLGWQEQLPFYERLQHSAENDLLTQSEKEQLEQIITKLTNWLNWRDRMSLAELLYLIVEDCNAFALLNSQFAGEQKSANLKKLIDLAERVDQNGMVGLDNFLQMIDDLINREVREGEATLAAEDSDNVKIMTIHSSKGLQFPVVFVPYLNRGLRAIPQSLFIDSELGCAATFKNIYKKEEEQTLNGVSYNLLKNRLKQKELAELKRVFYVAVSRASNYLFLSAKLEAGKVKNESMLELLLKPLDEKNINWRDSEKLAFKGFELTLTHSYTQQENNTNDAYAFLSFLDTLKKDAVAHIGKSYTPQTIAPVETGRTFSATALMTWAEDPELYFQRYHLGFFEGEYQSYTMYEKQNQIDSLLKGKIVHRYLELFKPGETDMQSLLERILFEYEVFDPAIKEIVLKDMATIIATMENSQHGKAIIQAKEVQNELVLTMRLGVDYFTGTIDRLQKNETGSWEVIDYKTNRISALKIEEEGQKYQMQMKAYAILVSQLYPQQEEISVSLYFLMIDRLYTKVFKREEVAGLRAEFQNLIEAIKQAHPVH